MNYTYFERRGSRIFYRWIEDGKRKKRVISGSDRCDLELFMKGNKNDSMSIYGDNLSRVEFSNTESALEFVKEYDGIAEIFGQTSVEHQFIYNTYPNEIPFDIKEFVIANIDIETEVGDGFPYPDQAKMPINAITIKCFNRDAIVTFGMGEYIPAENVIYTRCNTEAELLTKFLGYWVDLQPDIVTGWNVIGFDIPYIVNRTVRVLGEKTAYRLSPFFNETKNVFRETKLEGDNTSYDILGLIVFDYIELYKKFRMKTQESYRLDFIAGEEVGENKIDYSEYGDLMTLYKTNHQMFIEYNIKDVLLVEKIDHKLNYMFLAITIAYLAKVKPSEIFGQVKYWDNLIYTRFQKEGLQIPPMKRVSDYDGIEGGYVKVPLTGKHKWIVSLDLTSLYPSIIRQYNMSPETIIDDQETPSLDSLIDLSYNTSKLKESGHCMAANGTKYVKDVPGKLPKIITDVFKDRKKFKNMMLDKKREKELIIAEMNKRGITHV